MHERQESRDEDDIDRHLAMLHADFNCLACLLALVEESAAHLKLIFNRVNDTHIPSFTPSSSVSNLSFANLEERSSENINLNNSFGNVLQNNNDTIDAEVEMRMGMGMKMEIGMEMGNGIGIEKSSHHNINNGEGNRMDRRNAAALSMYKNTKDALMDCLNHISKSFELFLKHINTNPKLQQIYSTDQEQNDTEKVKTDVFDGINYDKNKPIGETISSVFNNQIPPNSDLISAYSTAENQILKIIRSQEDCKVR